MSTTQELTTIGQLLQDKRGDEYQTVTARKIGVSRQMYRQWEDGFAIPGPEWVVPLAEYLDQPASDVVTIIWRSWAVKHNVPIIHVM